jgi:Tol biopolymer transport system component
MEKQGTVLYEFGGRKMPNGTLLVVATLIVAAAISTFGIYKMKGRKPSVITFQNLKLLKLTTSGKVVTATISPDGRDLAYVTSDGGKETLWIKQVASGRDIEIVPASEGNYHRLSFSPDGNFIYYVRSLGDQPNTIFRVPALGGSAITLNKDVDSVVSFSPDGKYMAYLRGYPDQKETALIVAPSDGSNERKLTVLTGPSGFAINAAPSWSPDSKQIAAVGRQDEATSPNQQILIIKVSDGGFRPLGTTRWQQISSISWCVDGHSVVASATDQDSPAAQIYQVMYPSGQVTKVTNDLTDYQQISMTRDSRQVAALQYARQANVYLSPAAGNGKSVQLTSGNGDGLEGVCFGPDGSVVYSVSTNGNENLWQMDARGQDSRQLTNTEGSNRTPVVSPDGKYIVFSSDRSGALHLWRIDIDGSHPLELTHGVGDAYPQITPDNKWIIYRSYQNGNPNLFRVSVDGGPAVALTDRIAGPPVISPDGKYIACLYREVSLPAPKLAVIPISGGGPEKLLDLQSPAAALRWSSDGKGLTYARTVAGVANIWNQPITGAAPQQLTHFTSDLLFSVDWSRDGKWLVYSQGRRTRDVILLSGS